MVISRAWATCAKTVQIVSKFCVCRWNPKGKKQQLSINLSVVLPNALQVTSDLGEKVTNVWLFKWMLFKTYSFDASCLSNESILWHCLAQKYHKLTYSVNLVQKGLLGRELYINLVQRKRSCRNFAQFFRCCLYLDVADVKRKLFRSM